MKKFFKKSLLFLVVLMVFMNGLNAAEYGFSKMLSYSTDTHENGYDSSDNFLDNYFTSPHPGHWYPIDYDKYVGVSGQYPGVYKNLYDAGEATTLWLMHETGPVHGMKRRNALEYTIDLFDTEGYTIDFLLGDIEVNDSGAHDRSYWYQEFTSNTAPWESVSGHSGMTRETSGGYGNNGACIKLSEWWGAITYNAFTAGGYRDLCVQYGSTVRIEFYMKDDDPNNSIEFRPQYRLYKEDGTQLGSTHLVPGVNAYANDSWTKHTLYIPIEPDGVTASDIYKVRLLLIKATSSGNLYFDNFKISVVYGMDEMEADCTEMVDMGTTHNSDIWVGNYLCRPGTNDVSQPWGDPSTDEEYHDVYINSGMNVAMPECYPFSVYVNHVTRTDKFPGNLSPNNRSALFWVPMERLSLGRRALNGDWDSDGNYLETGETVLNHLLVPFMGGYVYNSGYGSLSDSPTVSDCEALIQHFRLRGADAYVAWSKGDNQNFTSTSVYREAIYDAWEELDAVFSTGSGTVLNLDTNKTGGVEWSGYKSTDGKIAIMISNLSGSSKIVDLPDEPGVPDTYTIANNTHKLLFYYDLTASFKNIRGWYDSALNGIDRMYLRGADSNGGSNTVGDECHATMQDNPSSWTRQWEFVDNNDNDGSYKLYCRYFDGPDGRLYLRGDDSNNDYVYMDSVSTTDAHKWIISSDDAVSWTIKCKNGGLYLRGVDANGSTTTEQEGLNCKVTVSTFNDAFSKWEFVGNY
jgi:hypothetical protein